MAIPAQYRLPDITAIPTVSTAERAAILDALFEHCTTLHTLSVDLLHTQKFESYDDLIATVGVQLTDLLESTSISDTQWLDSILAAHPRLGAAKVDSTQSQAEQAQLRAGGADEADQLAVLNAQYEATFPGLIYVVFVDGRPRDTIMKDMRARIERNDIRAERNQAIKAMCDIAADRARKLPASTTLHS